MQQILYKSVGIPKEVKKHEYRVSTTPNMVKHMV